MSLKVKMSPAIVPQSLRPSVALCPSVPVVPALGRALSGEWMESELVRVQWEASMQSADRRPRPPPGGVWEAQTGQGPVGFMVLG